MSNDEQLKWLVEQMGELRSEVADVRVTQAEIRGTQLAQQVSIDHHIRRTDLLETKVHSFWGRVLSVGGLLAGIAVSVLKIFELVSR